MEEAKPDANDELIDGGKVMSLLDHLKELRGTLIRSAVVVLVLFFAAITFSEHIIQFLKGPLFAAMPGQEEVLHFTGPMEVFSASIKVAFLSAILLSCPFWIYQFWKFFEPGLYPKERKYILPFIVASITLFFGGVLFCFYVMLPPALTFLIGMGTKVGTPIITINDYISLVTVLILSFGLVFETPIILILLAMLDLISAEQLSENRKTVVIIILIVAAILTPTPDPLSQVSMALPMYIMYEVSIVIIRFMKRKPPDSALTKT